MKTYPALSEIESKILAYCQGFPRSPVISDELIELIHPYPLFTAHKTIEGYTNAQEEWKTLAYGDKSMTPKESYSSICRQACTNLVKLGYILENNCGYGKFKYYITKWGLKYETKAQ